MSKKKKEKSCIATKSLQLCSAKQSHSQLLSHSINKFFGIQILRPSDPTQKMKHFIIHKYKEKTTETFK